MMPELRLRHFPTPVMFDGQTTAFHFITKPIMGFRVKASLVYMTVYIDESLCPC